MSFSMKSIPTVIPKPDNLIFMLFFVLIILGESTADTWQPICE